MHRRVRQAALDVEKATANRAGEDKAAVAVQGAEAEVLRKPLEVIMI